MLSCSSNLSVLSNGFDIMLAIIKRLCSMAMTHPTLLLCQDMASIIVAHMETLAEILKVDAGLYKGPFGEVPRFGLVRLKIVRFFADAILLDSAELLAKYVALELPQYMVELFFKFPTNSFLQSSVYDFLVNLVSKDWPQCKIILVPCIFRQSSLLHRISQAQRLSDSLAELPKSSRPPYMGHILQISDLIHGLLERHGAELYKEIGDLLRSEDWIEYSSKSYREAKLRDAFLLGGETAPAIPPPTEDVFNSIFTSPADESVSAILPYFLVYFCSCFASFVMRF